MALGAHAQSDYPSQLVATTSEGTAVYVRTDRVSRSAGTVLFWVYTYPKGPDRVLRDKPKPTYDYQISQWGVSCSMQGYRIGKTTYYNKGGVYVDGHDSQSLDFRTPTPDTVADVLVRTACEPSFGN